MEFKSENNLSTIFLPETVRQSDLHEFHSLVEKAIKANSRFLYVDCGNVMLIDSLLTGALIKALKNTRDNDCSLVLANVSPENRETLEQSSLDKILTIKQNGEIEEADSELGAMFKSEVEGKVVVVTFTGMMNGLDDAAKLKLMIQQYLADYAAIVFDFSEAIYIDSLGVGELVNLHRKIKQADGKLVFCGASEILKDLFKSLGLLQVIPYYNSRAEAIKHFN
jgi:anti-anti-sigma factor